MKTSLTAQQTAFYTKNGLIELEIPHPDLPTSDLTRDLWRSHPTLKEFLIKKLGPIALTLTRQKQLCLAFDQLITSENRPKKQTTLKEMFSIQGLSIAIAISNNPETPLAKSPLGILPMPSVKENVLFFKSEIILDFPHLLSDIYLVAFALPSAVYVQNINDPSTNSLKKLGLNFGDKLKNETHPVIL